MQASDEEMSDILEAWGSSQKYGKLAAKLRPGEVADTPPLAIPPSNIMRAYQV